MAEFEIPGILRELLFQQVPHAAQRRGGVGGVCIPDFCNRGFDGFTGYRKIFHKFRVGSVVAVVRLPREACAGGACRGGAPLYAFLTRSAFEELEEREGAEVVAVIKAPAVHVIGRGG